MTIRVGSRGSALALWQAHHVVDRLGVPCEIVVIATQGDKVLDVPLARIGDRGLFVKEIEEALRDGRVDLAVHSLKDLPTTQPAGLVLAAILDRADPRDCLVHRADLVGGLPADALIGTSSLRRRAQLQAAHPTWRFADVRGNVQTRLSKLDGGQFDALVLAAAGLERLGLDGRIARCLEPEECLPAVGQGALAVETRQDDAALIAQLGALVDPDTTTCVLAERSFLRALEGGCQVPIGAHARLEGEDLVLHGVVASLDGARVVRVAASGPRTSPDALGLQLATEAIAQGADDILAAIRAQ